MTRGTRSVVRALRTSPSLAWESFSVGGARRINSARGGLLSQLGYARKEWEASASFWLDIMPRVDRTRVLSLIEATFGQAKLPAEFQWCGKQGETVAVEAHLRILRSKTGEIQGVRGIAFDVTARKESESILRESIATRDHFLAMLAHEMRTPLSAIMGWATWMDEHPGELARARNALAAIVRCAELQSRLVEDVVDLSRGLFGKLDIAQDVVSIGAVLQAACDTIRPSAAVKHVGLELEIAEGLPGIVGDEGRLIQVLSNLVGNAVKFTPAGGRVGVAAARLPSQIEIVVRDTGRGIEAAHLDRLFEPFYQVRGASRPSAGMGLGLFVAKTIVESHGGEIAVNSAGLNCGTAVTVRLPLAAVERAPYREPMESGSIEIAVESELRGVCSTARRRRLPLSA